MFGIISLGGNCHDSAALREIIPEKYFAVAADSGAAHFDLLGIRPDLLVGDLDSISAPLLDKYEREKIPVLKYDEKKDFTDSEIAVDKALAAGCDSLLILGAFGNRYDHMISNQMMAAALAKKGIPVILTDGLTFFYTVTVENSPFIYPIQNLNATDDVISLVPMIGDAVEIVTENLEYPLKHETVFTGSTRAVSNVVQENNNNPPKFATVSLKSGVIFFIHTKSDHYLQNHIF